MQEFTFFLYHEKEGKISKLTLRSNPLFSPSQAKTQQSISKAADGLLSCLVRNLWILFCHEGRKARASSKAPAEGFPPHVCVQHIPEKCWEGARLPTRCSAGGGFGFSGKIRGPLSRGRNMPYSSPLAKVEYDIPSSSCELCCPVWTRPQTLS